MNKFCSTDIADKWINIEKAAENGGCLVFISEGKVYNMLYKGNFVEAIILKRRHLNTSNLDWHKLFQLIKYK